MNEILKNYCENKTICLVGNSSALINSNKGKWIDSHDIVVRFNGALSVLRDYPNDLGIKQSIYVASMLNQNFVQNQLKYFKGDIFIRPGKKVKSNFKTIYLKLNQPEGFHSIYPKATTGIKVLNYFKQYINYKELNLIGFDSFTRENNSNRINILGSFAYKDHNSTLEANYIEKCLNEKTHLIKL